VEKAELRSKDEQEGSCEIEERASKKEKERDDAEEGLDPLHHGRSASPIHRYWARSIPTF